MDRPFRRSFGNRRPFGGPREMHKATCAECGKEIDELAEEAIVDMPFAGELLSFCCEKCKNGT